MHQGLIESTSFDGYEGVKLTHAGRDAVHAHVLRKLGDPT